MADKKTGGLYAKVNMSVKNANILVAVTVALLVIVTIFIVNHGGFTVKFDTDGGSRLDSVKVMHAETVGTVDVPTKEGYTFTGWYTDSDCTSAWDVAADPVEGSMTLYAGWKKTQ